MPSEDAFVSKPGKTPYPAPLSPIRRASRPRKRGVKGYGGGKKIKGRKRHLIVGTLGLLFNVKVLPANLRDREGGMQLLAELHTQHPSLTSSCTCTPMEAIRDHGKPG